MATDTNEVIQLEQHSGRPHGPIPPMRPGLLAGAYLLHLYAHLERVGQHLYKLTEVYTLVGYVIEYRLVAVALIFDIAYLHLQMQILGYLAGADHSVDLAGLGLLKLLDIGQVWPCGTDA